MAIVKAIHSQVSPNGRPSTWLAFTLGVAMLAGCSGGGGGGSSEQQPQPPTSNNVGPTALFTFSPSSGTAPLTVSFDASESTDPDGSIANFLWAFGDGETAAGETANHVYSTTGTFTVVLTVRDDDDAESESSSIITVEALPPNKAPSAAFDVEPTSGTTPLQVNFNASSSRDEDGEIASFSWDFGDGGIGSGEAENHTFDSVGTFTVSLTVTDDAGAKTTVATDITVTAAMQTGPAGNASLGPVMHARVRVLDESEHEIGTGSTDFDGNYGPIAIPASYDGPLVVIVEADATGETVYLCDIPYGCPGPDRTYPIGDYVPFPESLELVAMTASVETRVNVNPFTTASAARARQLSDSPLTPAAILQANQEVEEALEKLIAPTKDVDLCYRRELDDSCLSGFLYRIDNIVLISPLPPESDENSLSASILASFNAALLTLVRSELTDASFQDLTAVISALNATLAHGSLPLNRNIGSKDGSKITGDELLAGMAKFVRNVQDPAPEEIVDLFQESNLSEFADRIVGLSAIMSQLDGQIPIAEADLNHDGIPDINEVNRVDSTEPEGDGRDLSAFFADSRFAEFDAVLGELYDLELGSAGVPPPNVKGIVRDDQGNPYVGPFEVLVHTAGRNIDSRPVLKLLYLSGRSQFNLQLTPSSYEIMVHFGNDLVSNRIPIVMDEGKQYLNLQFEPRSE